MAAWLAAGGGLGVASAQPDAGASVDATAGATHTTVSVRFSDLEAETFRALGGVRLERAVVARLVQDGFAVVNDAMPAAVELRAASIKPGVLTLTARAGAWQEDTQVTLGGDTIGDEAAFVFAASQAASLLVATAHAHAQRAAADAAAVAAQGASSVPPAATLTPRPPSPGYYDRPPGRPRPMPPTLALHVGVGAMASASQQRPVVSGGLTLGRRFGFASSALWWQQRTSAYDVVQWQVGVGPYWRPAALRERLVLSVALGIRHHRFAVAGVASDDEIIRLRPAGTLALAWAMRLTGHWSAEATLAVVATTVTQRHLLQDTTWQEEAISGMASLGLGYRF